MRASAVLLSLLVLVAALAGACGDGGDAGAGAGASSAGDALRGRTFLSTDVEGHQLVAATELRVTFNDDGTLGASAGCNQFVGELTIEGEILVVTNLGGTEMGCDPQRHAQDDWFTEFLSSRPTFRLTDDGGLTLRGGGVTIELLDRKVAEPDLPLVGTRWTVDTILEGDAASSVPGGAEAWVRFDADGQVSGHDGCNGFGGRYSVEDDRIEITERAQTLIGCPDLDTLTAAVAAATNGVVTYAIDAKRLTLTAADGRGVSATGGEAGS